LLFASLSLWID